MPVCQPQEDQDSTGALSARGNSAASHFNNYMYLNGQVGGKQTGPSDGGACVPSRALRHTSQTAATKLKNAALHLTHKHGLSSLLDEEELSPVGTACFHSKNDQVACGEHPEVRREQQLCQSAIVAGGTCKEDQEERYYCVSTAAEPRRLSGTTDTSAGRIHAQGHPYRGRYSELLVANGFTSPLFWVCCDFRIFSVNLLHIHYRFQQNNQNTTPSNFLYCHCQ